MGVAGTGKTTIVRDYLAELQARSDSATVSTSVNLNSYTTSAALQALGGGPLSPLLPPRVRWASGHATPFPSSARVRTWNLCARSHRARVCLACADP